MTPPAWPALDRLIDTLRTAPARTGSVISTIYGDAIMPRGGALDLSDLLSLMARLGAPEGVVRTAVSRLARDGVLRGHRTGRRSSYALTPIGEAEFRAATSRIYGTSSRDWDGRLHLAFPSDASQRLLLERAGFQPVAPGAMVAPHEPPSGPISVEASGSSLPLLAQRAWPIDRLNQLYETFLDVVHDLEPPPGIAPLDAITARIVIIHAWRRVALRDPQIPAALLPASWCGADARRRCITLYQALVPASERWLDNTNAAGRPLPKGPDPGARWAYPLSGDDRSPAAQASSRALAGTRSPPRSAPR